MDPMLEKVMSQAINGSRKAMGLADDLETMFEMWTGYMTDRLGEANFLSRLQVYEDRVFNLDGYQPTIMPVAMDMIEDMTSIGVDVIKPSPLLYGEDTAFSMVMEDIMAGQWLLFTIVEQGHPLKGLRYVVGYCDGELKLSCADPQFADTYTDEEAQTGCRGTYIDKRERFLRMARGDIFE